MYLPGTKKQETIYLQDYSLVRTSYNQGLSDIKQLTDNIDEANQWCTITIITMCLLHNKCLRRSFTMSKDNL